MKKVISLVILILIAYFGYHEYQGNQSVDNNSQTVDKQDNAKYDIKIDFPKDKYPETAEHIKEAIKKGESNLCTIDRDGAEENRKKSLEGIPIKKGYDRDEWPMAMCAEGGTGADIMYISPSDNRGAGSWFSHKLSEYPDGTKVKVVVD